MPEKDFEKNKSKYQPGFDETWLEDKDLMKDAEDKADFYLKNLEIETAEDEVGLVHFSPETIENEIENRSEFYDCDLTWLQEQGIEIDEENANKNFVLAIPLESLKDWVNTRTWIKLCQSGVLSNATVFSQKKEDLIVRDHQFIEETFENSEDEERDLESARKYYTSTGEYDDEQELQMPEVWIDGSVAIDKNVKQVNYKAKEKNLYFMDADGGLESDDKQKAITEGMRKVQETPIEGELEKSPELSEFINWAIPKMGEMLSEFGIDLNEPNEEMVHLLPEEVFKKYKLAEDVIGCCGDEGVLLNEAKLQKVDLDTATVIVHELFHYYGFNKYYHFPEIQKHEKSRSGVAVKSGSPLEVDGDIKLDGMNEAIVQTLTNSFYLQHIREEEKFKDEVRELDSRLTEEEIEQDHYMIPGPGGYHNLEEMFKGLVQKITDTNEDNFDYQDIMTMFIKSHVNGRLMPVARLLRKIDKNCLTDLSNITSKNNLERIAEFRKKYDLGEDEELNKEIEASNKINK